MPLACPFCGAPETDRFALEGHRTVVFRCLFAPQIPPDGSEEELAREILAKYGPDGDPYFRGVCDRLHFYVTKGPAARELGAEPG